MDADTFAQVKLFSQRAKMCDHELYKAVQAVNFWRRERDVAEAQLLKLGQLELFTTEEVLK